MIGFICRGIESRAILLFLLIADTNTCSLELDVIAVRFKVEFTVDVYNGGST
jgi:hypothetical protein